MAAVTVTFNGTRVNDAEALTNWANDGINATLEPDFFYQGANCISGQVKTNEVGFRYTSGATDMTTPRVWLAKVIQTNKDGLTGNGLTLRIGSTTANYYGYNVFTAITYPTIGGWQIVPIDPNIAAYRDATLGTPNLASVTHWAIRSQCLAISKAPNLGIDAIDYIASGTGLTLVGGDGADPDGTFTNFVTTDEGTVTNRWGIVGTREGILYVTGVLTIGTATATVFDDTARTLVFPDGRFDTGFCGIDFGLNSATTVITISQCSFLGIGTQGANDTRPDYEATNTSGTLSVTGSAFRVFRNITLTSSCTFTDVIVTDGLRLTQGGATITGLSVSGQTTATGVAFLLSTNPTLISDSTFTAGVAGHAIEITTPGTYTFSNNEFFDYGATDTNNAAIYNNSGGAVTINVSGGTVPTYRNGTGASTTVVAAVTITLTGLETDTEVRAYTQDVFGNNDVEIAGVENSGTSFAFSAEAGEIINIMINHLNFLPADLWDFLVPSANASVPISQVIDRQYFNPPGP